MDQKWQFAKCKVVCKIKLFFGSSKKNFTDPLTAENNTPDLVYAKLSTLIQWHEEDGVSNWERNRNDIIYYNYQHNRNPFIDHPEYVNLIWGDNNEISENETKHISGLGIRRIYYRH